MLVIKRLELQFWKARNALCMQVLDIKGVNIKHEGHVRIQYDHAPSLSFQRVCLPMYEDLSIAVSSFGSDRIRDQYLNHTIDAITRELFSKEDGLWDNDNINIKIKTQDSVVNCIWEVEL